MRGSPLHVVHAIQDVSAISGGPTSALVGLLEFQRSAGVRSTVVCATGAQQCRSDGIDGFPGHGVRAIRRTLEGRWRADRPDIVHVHGVWDPVVRAACGAASSLGIPWVLSSHGMLHPDALARHALRKRLYLAMFGSIVRDAAGVLVLNREEAAHAHAAFGVETAVVPAGVDIPPAVLSATGAFRATAPGLGVAPFLLFIGRLDPIKGIDLLIESYGIAVRRGLAHHLVIVGPDFGARPSIERQVSALDLHRCVHLPGPAWGSARLDALADCAFFVHRPRYEGYGLAAVEAMAVGRAVVTTARCRLDDACAAGAVHVVADTAEGFADGILELAHSPDRLAAQAAHGRAWAVAHGGWDAMGARTSDCYRSAIARAR
jgi:glycosyltransferase involved in cell wall biosynthesis